MGESDGSDIKLAISCIESKHHCSLFKTNFKM